jgi:serine/threonine protein kinase
VDPAVGMTIDRRYALRREVARGGMSIVFEARHLFTGRTVAVKLLHDELSGDKRARERLLREARALTLARHPHVVEVLDAGTTDSGLPYVSMEMLDGRTLAGILTTRQRLPIADTVHAGRQICEALAFAHARGVVHRDLKPGNVLLVRNEVGEEVVKLIDFGIATVGSSPDEAPRPSAKLTKRGEILGTPEYMAPEQLLQRDDVDHRCDIYATAATLYECLTGRAPYAGSFAEVMLQVMTGNRPAPLGERPEIGPRLASVLDRALAREPSERFQDALAFARALGEAASLTSGRSSLLGIQLIEPRPAGLASVRPEPVVRVVMPAEPSDLQPTMLPHQRRRFPRAPYVTPIKIHRPDGKVIVGRTEDISEGGMLVLTALEVGKDEALSVRLALPSTGQMVTLASVAKWVRAARSGSAIGLEFVGLPEDVKAVITAYVEAMGMAPG